MKGYAKWFGVVVIIGVIFNIVLAIAALLAPDWLLGILGLELAIPTVWVKFSANLLILLSLFYIPAAINPYQYQVNAWLAVFCRCAGVVFFLTQPRDYLLFSMIDLSFAIPEGILLWLALRSEVTLQKT